MNSISNGLQSPSDISPGILNMNELYSWMLIHHQIPFSKNEEELPEFRMKDNLFTI